MTNYVAVWGQGRLASSPTSSIEEGRRASGRRRAVSLTVPHRSKKKELGRAAGLSSAASVNRHPGNVDAGRRTTHPTDLHRHRKIVAIDVRTGNAGVDLVHADIARQEAAPIDNDPRFLDQRIAEIEIH